MRNDLLDFHTDLKATKNTAETWALLQRFAEPLGIGQMNAFFGTCRDDAWFLTNRPDWWTPHYLEKEYFKFDHLVLHFFMGSGLLPFKLERDAKNPRLPEKTVRLLQEAREGLDLGGGVAFPLMRTDGTRCGGVSIASANSVADFDALPTSDVLAVISATTAALTKVNLIREGECEISRLSPRERECLLWLSKGMRTKEISDKLNLADATVLFHLNNAKAKLGAETREQAVARAVVLGLIAP